MPHLQFLQFVQFRQAYETAIPSPMDKLNLRFISLAGVFAAAAAPGALAQGQPVAWSPSYVGTCTTCELSGRNLTGWTLTGANYAEAKMDRAVLSDVNAVSVNFERADLTGADMRRAVFTNAKLAGVKLTGARMMGFSAIGADLSGAAIYGANLEGATLIGANLKDAHLMTALLGGADLSTANLQGAFLDKADLRGAVLNGANLRDARLNGANIAGASFKDARFPGADLQSVVGFEEADFEGACGSLTTRLPPDMRLPTCTKAQLAVRLSPDPE